MGTRWGGKETAHYKKSEWPWTNGKEVEIQNHLFLHLQISEESITQEIGAQPGIFESQRRKVLHWYLSCNYNIIQPSSLVRRTKHFLKQKLKCFSTHSNFKNYATRNHIIQGIVFDLSLTFMVTKEKALHHLDPWSPHWERGVG